jgi:hypothetical protein
MRRQPPACKSGRTPARGGLVTPGWAEPVPDTDVVWVKEGQQREGRVMKVTSIRGSLVTGAAGMLLAAGAITGANQAAGQQAVEAQQAQQEQIEVGRGLLPEPQWQYYDHLRPGTGALAWLPFQEVLGSAVLDDTGQPIGEIIGLVRSQAEDDFYAVVEPVPEHQVVVPARHLEVRGDRQIVFTAPEPIEMMPAWGEVGPQMVTLAELPREPQPMQPQMQPQVQPQTPVQTPVLPEVQIQ